jgi:hypothetical protein
LSVTPPPHEIRVVIKRTAMGKRVRSFFDNVFY